MRITAFKACCFKLPTTRYAVEHQRVGRWTSHTKLFLFNRCFLLTLIWR